MPRFDAISKDWPGFRGRLSEFSEQQLDKALNLELEGLARTTVVVAIHRRLARLRTDRERQDLKQRCRKNT